MAREIFLVKDGMQKVSFLGFSWTTLFFGQWVALFRGDWKGFFILFIVLSLVVALGSFMFIFNIVAIILQIVAAIYYNKYYTSQLIARGFRPSNETTEIELEKEGISYN